MFPNSLNSPAQALTQLRLCSQQLQIFESQNHEKKFRTHEILTTQNFEPMKYPRENIWDPRYNHEDTILLWH